MASDKRIADMVAHLPSVKNAVRDKAHRLKAEADGKLASHRKTGRHHITVETGRVDSHVVMHGPAALSLEVGHHTQHGNWVEGIHVLSRGDG